MTNEQTAIRRRRVAAGGVCWEVLTDWQDVLLGPGGLRLDEWLEQGFAQVVKHGLHRTVYRVELPHRAFFVKHYRTPALFDSGRHLVRASASRREYRRAIEVSRRQVPTVKPVAVGEYRRHGLVHDNFLVTEAVPHSCSLDEYVRGHLPQLVPQARAVMRRKLIRSVARLAAAAHQAGVFHNDFHAGNILVRIDTCHTVYDEQLPELHLLDLPGVKLSRSLGWRQSRDSLVMLGAAWLAATSRSELRRFWREYLAARPDLRLADERQAAREIAKRLPRRARRVVGSRDKRSLRTNRDFYQLQTDAFSGHAVAELSRDEFEFLLADPDRPLRENRHRTVKLTHRSVVVEAELLLAGVARRIAYKRVRPRNWLKACQFLVCPDPALAAWRLGHAMRQRGIATPRPLAVCRTRGWGLRRDSFLATEWITGAQNLHLYGWRLAKYEPVERSRRARQTASALGGLLGRMHAWHVSHRDLKGCNLLLVEQPDAIEAYFIDLDSVRICRRLSDRQRVRNLARLAASLAAHPWVSRTDRLRFLRSYLLQLAPGRQEWKPLWRAIAAASHAIARRIAARGDVVA